MINSLALLAIEQAGVWAELIPRRHCKHSVTGASTRFRSFWLQFGPLQWEEVETCFVLVSGLDFNSWSNLYYQIVG